MRKKSINQASRLPGRIIVGALWLGLGLACCLCLMTAGVSRGFFGGLQCPGDQTIGATQSGCQGLVPDFTTLVVPGLCNGTVTITQDPAPGSLLGLGNYSLQFTVDCGLGNSTQQQCFSTLFVTDQSPPVFDNCPNVLTYVVPVDSNCTAAMPDFTATLTATDNCDPNPVLTQSVPAGTPIVGITNMTHIQITATDAAGNSTICEFDVQGTDQTAPTFNNCPTGGPVELPVGANCQAVVPDFTTTLTASDNCDPSPIITQDSPAPGTLIGLGNFTPVTMFATDTNGNVGVCFFSVIGVDETPPIFTNCPVQDPPALAAAISTLLPVGANCKATIPDYTTLLTVTDNCDPSPQLTQLFPEPGTQIGLGNTTLVSVQAIDASDNTSFCEFIVIPVDTTPPTVVGKNITVALDGTGHATIAAADVYDATASSDNCSAVTLQSASPLTFDCTNVGANTVTVTAKDVAGNVGTGNATVTITNAAPTIAQNPGPAAMTVAAGSTCPNDSNSASFSATDADGTDSLTWSVPTAPTLGTAAFANNLSTGASVSICYQPAAGQTANDSFVVKVSDPCGASDQILVNVTVTSEPAGQTTPPPAGPDPLCILLTLLFGFPPCGIGCGMAITCTCVGLVGMKARLRRRRR